MSSSAFRVIIPARYGSTRLPGKPLRDIAGKPMLQHVYERALQSGASEVIIAAEDARVRSAVEAFGGQVCMTSTTHRSGSERIAEVVSAYAWPDDSVIVNVQGDEPLIPPAVIARTAQALLAAPAADMATLCCPITSAEKLFDPNIVKVVCNRLGQAMYFSRAPIPWHRDAFSADQPVLPDAPTYYHHIGIYSYRVGYLKQYAQSAEAQCAQAESLEQLRALYNGAVIQVLIEEQALPAGVDTEQDLQQVRAQLQA